LQKFSPYDDFEINEKHMIEDTMERYASPLTPFDPIITLYKGILGGGCWAMPPNLGQIH
jgi:hypothetical protein